MIQVRNYSLLDQLCISVDQTLRTLTGHAKTTVRVYPAKQVAEAALTDKEKQHAAALMRINHAGEVCAQALYHGQAAATHNQSLRRAMQQAAIEEGDHLAWCSERLQELGSHTSYLNPFWYAGSFAIGFSAGMIGDKWSLGFVAETERQVVAHLEKHMKILPESDQKSMSILQQMQQDEALHRDHAIQSGAAVLPLVVQKLMRWTSKIMVKVAYYF